MADRRDQDELLKVDVDSIVEKGKKRSKLKIAMIVLAGAILVFGIILFMRGTPVEDIAFSDNEVEVIAGKSLELNYTILPNNATNKGIVWESSDTEIAKVDDKGVITALKKGTVTVTATAANGKRDECLVTVKPTAFEFLKELSATKNGYTIGNSSSAELGTDASLGAYYQENEDSIYILLATENPFNSSLASIVIPSSLSGEYKGYLEFNSRSAGTITTTYFVDAASFTSETSLRSFYSDSSPSSTSINDELYTSDLRNMLTYVYQEILEPNGYTYADLGFVRFK